MYIVVSYSLNVHCAISIENEILNWKNKTNFFPPETQRKLYNDNMRHLLCLISLGLMSAITAALCCHFLLEGELSPGYMAVIITLWFLISIDIYFPPLVIFLANSLKFLAYV